MKTTARLETWPWIHLLVLLTAMGLGLVIGGDRTISPLRIVTVLGADAAGDPEVAIDRTLLIHNRIPRVLCGALVGACLALAGVLMQGLFRNPLASPGILGATAGGAFGAVLAVALGFQEIFLPGKSIAAVAGTLVALVVVYLMAATRPRLSIAHLLLCGLAVNTLFSAGTSLILTFSADRYWISREIINWLTGSLSEGAWSDVLLILPFFVIAAPLSIYVARQLDLVLLGEESAQSLGVSLDRLKWWVLLISALLTGGAIAIAGMIGFVGLVVPHIIRLFQGPGHCRLMVSAPLFGGAFLVLCDVLAQNVIPPEEIQIGIITSLIGGPFFLFLLIRERKAV